MKAKFHTSSPLSALTIAIVYTLYALFTVAAYRPEYNLSFWQLRLMHEMPLFALASVLAAVFVVTFVSRLLHWCATRRKGTALALYLLWLLAEYAIIVAAVSGVVAVVYRGSWQEVMQAVWFPALVTFLPADIVVALWSARKEKSEPPKAPNTPEIPENQKKPENPEIPEAPENPEIPEETENQGEPKHHEEPENPEPAPEPEADGMVDFVDEKGVLKLSVLPQHVYYIESAGNYVTVAYQNGDRLMRQGMRGSMKAMTPMAEQCGLLRCHRSYFINPEKISSIQRDGDNAFAKLAYENTNPIPITKTYLQDILNSTETK